MSEYLFHPSPYQQEHYAFWDGGFSQDEITRIRTLGDSMIEGDQPNAIVDSRTEPKLEVRRSQVSWLTTENASWVYDRLSWIARQLNGLYFQFDVGGFSEHFQYTVYNEVYAGTYDWHIDKHWNMASPPRKLSISVQLSSPDEYEGGELQLLYKKEPETMKKDLGSAIMFPSYMLHRVTPVTKGVRRSLVVWIYGPRFK